MSEPITLTDRERAVFARVSRNLYRAANELPPGDIEVHSAMLQVGMVLERMWREDAAKAESASPPRAPAEPIDICERLEASASEWADQQDEDAILSREAAAEIRRLRGEIAAMNSLVDRTFDDLGVLREQVKTERRAGIEAAAKYHDTREAACWAERDTEGALRHEKDAAAIRALADKPAPDPLLAGLAHVREHLRTDGHAVRLIAWLDAEIAARGGTEGG